MMIAVLRCLVIVFILSGFAFAQSGVDVAAKRIRIVLKAEPPNLNSLRATDNISGFVLTHVIEGLTQYNERNEVVPGVAERWDLRADGATFWLRRNARWSDGKPVTAHDFVFAWRQVVNPVTASSYAFSLYPIKNAERINRGEVAVDSLGVRAVDDYRLEVTFERPCSYFLGLVAGMTYMPVREDFYRARGERFAADAGDLLYNGPFMLSRWNHGAHLTLDKNPLYWNAPNIRLNQIDIPFITGDISAGFNLFLEGSIALAQLNAETLGVATERGIALKLFDTSAFYFLAFNFRDERITKSLHLRRAIQAIFSSEQVVNKVIALPGVRPGVSLFPAIVKGQQHTFREEYPPLRITPNLQLARRELELAKQELGVSELPPLVLLANTSSLAWKQTNFLQQLLSASLGIDVRIDMQIFKQAIAKMNQGDFDIALAGWGADFDDAITYGDLMASWNDNNRGRYSNPAYDALVRTAYDSADQQVRMTAFGKMQRIIYADVPILPLYEHAEIYAMDPRLHGVGRLLFGGDLDFRYAYVEELKQ